MPGMGDYSSGPSSSSASGMMQHPHGMSPIVLSGSQEHTHAAQQLMAALSHTPSLSTPTRGASSPSLQGEGQLGTMTQGHGLFTPMQSATSVSRALTPHQRAVANLLSQHHHSPLALKQGGEGSISNLLAGHLQHQMATTSSPLHDQVQTSQQTAPAASRAEIPMLVREEKAGKQQQQCNKQAKEGGAKAKRPSVEVCVTGCVLVRACAVFG